MQVSDIIKRTISVVVNKKQVLIYQCQKFQLNSFSNQPSYAHSDTT